MKKAIVTGANGFVGTAICEELSGQGYEVIAIIRNENENTDKIKDLPGLRIVYCDISDFKKLSRIVDDRDIDIMYHLAWVGSAGSLRGDSDVQIKNIQYACDTIKICKEINCKRFVFASSIMEYEIDAQMATETTPSINTLYSSAKLAADYMIRTLAGSLGVAYIRAVISNIYGPGEQSPRLINTSIRKILAGEHCSFSPGNQIYDFIYITDAAKAFVAIGEYGVANRTYYIGSLSPRPLKDYLIELGSLVDPDAQLGIGELPFSGVSLSYTEFDIYAIMKDTGFVPKVKFNEGINKTIQWIKEVDR